MTEPAYSVGIEEEYFVFNAATRRTAPRMARAFYREARQRLGNQVTTELLQSQIEVMTAPHAGVDAAGSELRELRRALGATAGRHRLGIAACGTFPLAFWPEQTPTQKPRYTEMVEDLQMLALRNMVCGMHVHVAVPAPARRIELMYRLVPFLPLLLALSAASPFWQGQPTGLHAYRPTAYDELPRTGIPELFRRTEDYDEFVAALQNAGIIRDASYIWWSIRPSLAHPTLELRIADCCPDLADALAIAALFQCLVRAVSLDPDLNADFDRVGRAITVENKWHAQRHGRAATFVHPFTRDRLPLASWLEQVIDLAAPHAAVLGSLPHLDSARAIPRTAPAPNGR